jgi:hypothetical protein
MLNEMTRRSPAGSRKKMTIHLKSGTLYVALSSSLAAIALQPLPPVVDGDTYAVLARIRWLVQTKRDLSHLPAKLSIVFSRSLQIMALNALPCGCSVFCHFCASMSAPMWCDIHNKTNSSVGDLLKFQYI